jgi:undecaprenyl-phosphate 4-deoxy-4-formamido-L-arabinose transferase
MIDGEIARTLAAYSGNGIYLDVALFWIASKIGYCQIKLRNEGRPSSYSYYKLIGHFWKLIITTGTRPLRLITLLGFVALLFALAVSIYAIYGKFIINIPVAGWTSLMIVTSVFSGFIMVSIGVVAEYLAITMTNLMGKPLYSIASKPTRNVNN